METITSALFALDIIAGCAYAGLTLYGVFVMFRASPLLALMVLGLCISTVIAFAIPFFFGTAMFAFRIDYAKAFAEHYKL